LSETIVSFELGFELIGLCYCKEHGMERVLFPAAFLSTLEMTANLLYNPACS
jgi:hypothetical protein